MVDLRVWRQSRRIEKASGERELHKRNTTPLLFLIATCGACMCLCAGSKWGNPLNMIIYICVCVEKRERGEDFYDCEGGGE